MDQVMVFGRLVSQRVVEDGSVTRKASAGEKSTKRQRMGKNMVG